MKFLKKSIVSVLLAAYTVGCGGSGGVPVASTGGNFVSTTVEVEQRFLYVLNSDSTVSAFVFPEEEEGHDHDHAHGRVLAQEDHEHEEEHEHEDDHEHEEDHEHEHGGGEATEVEPEELAFSPIRLGGTTLIDIAMIEDGHLVTLDASGTLTLYAIDVLTGQLSELGSARSGVNAPRRLYTSHEHVAVLGERLSLSELSEGELSDTLTLEGTDDWVDVELGEHIGAASTAAGAEGFTWTEDQVSTPTAIALPGAVRGEIAFADGHYFVANTADGSLSKLAQSSDGALDLEETYPLDFSAPGILTPLFEGADLLLAGVDTVVLLHPEGEELEEEARAELPRVPSRLFDLPESDVVLVGHDSGIGSTELHFEGEEIEVHEESGPGGLAPQAFGWVERRGVVTQTSEF